jgi:hypothetical protein
VGLLGTNRESNGSIILCNQLGRLPRILAGIEGPVHWFVPTQTPKTRCITDYLRSRPGTLELDVAQHFRKRREVFRKQYLQMLARLSIQNACFDWWTLPPTNKDPYSTNLCREVAVFLLIVSLVRQNYVSLLVVTGSADLAAQVKSWARNEPVRVVDAIRSKGAWRRLVKLYTPAGVIKACISTIYRSLVSPRYRPDSRSSDGLVVVLSLVYPSSFHGEESRDYQDVYFGPLVNYLERAGRHALVMGIMRGPFGSLAGKLKRLRTKVPVIPVEGFLSASDIIWCTFHVLRVFTNGVQIKGELRVEGVDVEVLVRRMFIEASRSGNPFVNLRVYRAGLRLARTFAVERCIYPHENRTWEKMLMLAMRQMSCGTRMIGYQHAAITPSHLHFFLEDGEAGVTPMPDVLLTTGDFTQEWLAREGGYPPGVVQAACGLRQRGPTAAHPLPKAKGKANRLLVVLGNPDLEDYVGTMKLLESALDGSDDRQVVIRPHPTNPVSIKGAIDAAALSGRLAPSMSRGDLRDALEEADVVIYASSTVAIEAASIGLPAICLDLGNALDTDPMWGWNEFKWRADSPDTLVDALEEIDGLSQEQFQALSQRAKTFAHAYLTPVSDKGVIRFLEV